MRNSSLLNKLELLGVIDNEFRSVMNNVRPVFPNHNCATVVNDWRVFSFDFADISKYVLQCLFIVVSKLLYGEYEQVNTRRTCQERSSLRGTKNESDLSP
jgi:hypothetical protein